MEASWTRVVETLSLHAVPRPGELFVPTQLVPPHHLLINLNRGAYLYKEKGAAFEKSHKRDLFGWTLAAAVVEATGVALAARSYAVGGPGGPLLIAVHVALLVAGTLGSVKLTNVVSHRGLGEGTSTLICASVLGGASRAVTGLWQAASSGGATAARGAAAVAAAWTGLVVAVVLLSRLEWRIPLRFLKVGAGRAMWWRRISLVDAQERRPHLPARAATSAMMVLIFAQMMVLSAPAAVANAVPAARPAVAAFLGSPVATGFAMTVTMCVMQVTAGLSGAGSASKFLERTQTGLDVPYMKGHAHAMAWERRSHMRALERDRDAAARDVLRAEAAEDAEVSAQAAAQLPALERAIVELRRADDGERADTRLPLRIPPGRPQLAYLRSIHSRVGLAGGLLLSAIYLVGTGLDTHARRALDVEVTTVSFLIVAGLGTALAKQITALAALARSRDAGLRSLAPTRWGGAVAS